MVASTQSLSGAVPPDLSAEELADIARKVDESCRKEKMNTVEKRWKRSEAHERAWAQSNERLMLNVIDFSHGREPLAKRIARQRAYARATVAWLDANPGCDLDDASVATHLKLAHGDLARACELEGALSEVKNIENDWEEGAPSRTQKRLKEMLDDEMKGIGRWLTRSLRPEQVELLKTHGYVGNWRKRSRWRLERQYHGADRARVIFLDVRLCAHLAESFEAAVRTADTQRDVRALLAAWFTEAVLMRDAGGTRFVGRGFIIYAI